jgi:hypothetical protein
LADVQVLTEQQAGEATAAHTLQDRVALIHGWMVAGVYHKGCTARLLAAAWGVDRSTVHGYSSQAVGILRRELGGQTRAELLTEIVTRIGAIGEKALLNRREVLDGNGDVRELRSPDYRSAIRAAESQAELLGLALQPQRVVATADHQLVEHAALPAGLTLAEQLADGVTE